MAVFSLEDTVPQVHETAWVAESATVIGHVRLEANASVWYGAVVRGDNEPIVIGQGSNVQDGSVLHTDLDCPLIIGADVTVGHQVCLHGCTIGDGSLVGIQAVVLNRARIGRRSMVGAGSLVTEGKEFPDDSLLMGSPAKVVRVLSAEQAERVRLSAVHYTEKALRHHRGLRRIG